MVKTPPVKYKAVRVKQALDGYHFDVLASIFALPVFWAFFLWLLPWLEERTLTPEERADKIQHLLENEAPDEIERRVAELLAHSIADQDRARTRSVPQQARH